MASVILLTKNAGPVLETGLSAVLNQATGFRYEVIAVDSGSTDETLDRLRRPGVRLHQIPPEEFGFGRTKNVAVGLATGRYVVFLSQDAVPATDGWLAALIERLESQPIVAVSGRQLPWATTNPVERCFVNDAYPAESQLYGPSDAGRFVIFSNVNSAIRREVLQRLPFAENIRMSEDQAWAQAALQAGYSILYDAAASVYHAHHYSPLGIFRRSFESGTTLRTILPRAGGLVRRRGLGYAGRQASYLIATGAWWWLPYAGIYEGCRVAGYLTGLQEPRLPRAIRSRLRHYQIMMPGQEAEWK